VLKAEGIVFSKWGKASAAQRMTAADLARMMDLETAAAAE
jgi:hypothetical protein